MTQQTQEREEQGAREKPKTDVKVTANYLPSTETFKGDFPRTATLGEVRTAVMTFFKKADFQDRDAHTFHLMFADQQRDDLGTTLGALIPGEKHKAQFELVELIKAG